MLPSHQVTIRNIPYRQVKMTYYGQDYMLEDKTGWLTGSDYDDIHDRKRLTLKCTQHEQTHTVYMIFDRTGTSVFNYNNPLAVLEFGPNNTFGTVSFQTGVRIPMKHYLVRVSTLDRCAVDPVCMINIYLRVSKLQISHAKVRSTGWATVSVALAHQT